MKILFIYSQIPLPLIDGGKKASFYTAFYLKQLGHEIIFISLNDIHLSPDISMLKEIGEVNVVQHDKTLKIFGAGISLFSKIPYYLKRFHKVDVKKKIDDIFEHNKFDVVITESLHCAEYGIYIKEKYGIPIVLRSHNYETAIVEKVFKNTINPFKKIFSFIEYSKLKMYEKSKSEVFDLVLMITEKDEKKLKTLNPKIKTKVFPAGVDLDFYSSENMQKQSQLNNILWIGALSWQPNRDSLMWFVKKIFPQIVKKKESAILKIIGSNAPQKFPKYTDPNIIYHGFVSDVRPYYTDSQVCVVPLRIGSGMRVKILEMMAMGKAIVTTSLGCEGIPVNDGEHLVIADTEENFAEKVVMLLNNETMRNHLAKNARLFVEKNYSWKELVEKINIELLLLIDLKKFVK